MMINGLMRVLLEQIAVILSVLAYLSGIITIRPHPDPTALLHTYDDTLDSIKASAEVDKTVLVVIDALRADHVASTRQPLMPHLHKLVNTGKARGYVIHTSSPTVTLPRIKSMVTGGIPGFMDVIENFGAHELTEDNLINQWKDQGRSIHFYGDDTWLRIFPHHFTQHEAVTSFFVTDYTDVDLSVTQHLERELSSTSQWDALILHYVGLDHIGHLEGPGSHLIAPKLIEMDTVIKNIHKALQEKGERFLIVVCGDHGMSDAGGHGGSSYSEITTSAVLISNTFPPNMDTTVRDGGQIDLTSTLAVLTGTPIPSNNLGRPLPFILSNMDLHNRLNGHRRVSRQLLSVARSCGLNPDHGNAELLFEEATRLHKLYLEAHPVSYVAKNNTINRVKDGERAVRFYQESERVASKELTSHQQSYDLPTIFTALFLVCVISLISLWWYIRQPSPLRDVTSIHIMWCCVVVLVLWLLLCAANPSTNICQPMSLTPWLLIIPLVYIFILFATVLANCGRRYMRAGHERASRGGYIWMGCVAGCIIHTISLLGTSLVEEEHQTVYFLATSLQFALLISLTSHSLRDRYRHDLGTTADLNTPNIKGVRERKGKTGSNELEVTDSDSNIGYSSHLDSNTNTGYKEKLKDSPGLQNKGKRMRSSEAEGSDSNKGYSTNNSDSSIGYNVDSDTPEGPILPTGLHKGKRMRYYKLIVLISLSILLSRILRAWNSTGDKWRHLEDISDILRAQGDTVMMGAVLCALGLTLALLGSTSWPLVILACIGIYGHHFPFLTESGTFEAQVAHLSICLVFILGLWYAKLVTFVAYGDIVEDSDTETRTETLLKYSYTSLALLAVLLQRPDNTPLMALLLLQDRLAPWFINRLVLTRLITPDTDALAIYILALAHFFFQGNSNSLSTIEVRSGFVGIGSFHPAIHGILIAAHTFAAPTLTHLSYLTRLTTQRRHEVLGIWWCVRVTCLALYLTNLTFQRNHLFIWTVLTPKLLYEGAHTLALTALTLFIFAVEKVCTLLQVTYRFEQ